MANLWWQEDARSRSRRSKTVRLIHHTYLFANHILHLIQLRRNANHMRYSLVAWVSRWPSKMCWRKRQPNGQYSLQILAAAINLPITATPPPGRETSKFTSCAQQCWKYNHNVVRRQTSVSDHGTCSHCIEAVSKITKHRTYENDELLGPKGHVANIYVHSGFQMSKLQGCTYILFISFPFFIFIHIIYKSNYDHPSICRSTGWHVGYGSNTQLCCNHPTSSDVFPPWQGSTEKVGSTGHVLGNIVSR